MKCECFCRKCCTMIPTANDTKTFPVRKTKSKVKILLLSLEMGRHCDKVQNDYESTLSNCPVKSWLSKYTVSGTRRHNMMVALMLNRWSQGLERWLDIALSRPAQITSWPCYDCVWSCCVLVWVRGFVCFMVVSFPQMPTTSKHLC